MNAPALAGAAGILWLARAGVVSPHPRYYDPTTALDYTAVVLTTLMTFVMGLAILAARPRLGRVARVLALIPAFGSIVIGVANLFEDAFGVEALGALWGLGGLTVFVGLLATSVAASIEAEDRTLGVALFVFTAATFLPEEVRAWVQGGALMLTAAVLARPARTEGAVETVT